MKIEYVDKDTVVCEDDHPRVYYRLKEGEVICGYCNKKFVHINKNRKGISWQNKMSTKKE